MNIKKIITIVSVVLISVLMIYGLILLNLIFSANTKFTEKEVYVYVLTDSKYDDVKKILAPYVKNMNRFDLVASKRGYDENVVPGRFLLTNGMNSYALVKAMRMNLPVKLAFNNQERVEDLAGRVGSQIEADSLSLLTSFKDSIFLK